MKTKNNYRIKEIINELKIKHSGLIIQFPQFTIDSGIIYGVKNTETPFLKIELFHYQIVSARPCYTINSHDWSVINKFKNNSIMAYEQVVLMFTTLENFDKKLIPDKIFIFKHNYSHNNKFQIQHLKYG